jgi:sugar phosphate isomerase/epimerase
MKRRDFLLRSASGATGIALFPTLLTSCATAKDPLHDFGLITNVVKDLMKEDHRGTMSLLAEMGYKYLEFGSTYGEKPAQLKAFMDEIGLIPLAGGTSIAGLLGDGLQKNIDACLEMDKKYLVCYWPWMDDGNSPTLDEVKFAVEKCMRMGEICNKNGLRLAYHNHDQEFQSEQGVVLYDYILENTEADLVTMQIDLYWSHKGKVDIREYFKRYPGRFEMVHIKDSYDSPDRESFAPVGDGIIDFTDLLSYRDVAGFKYLIVENDQPGKNQEAVARTSIQHLQSLKF